MILQYGSHELQTIKVFNKSPSTRDTIVFIHGGGWRDPHNTYDDFRPIIEVANPSKEVDMNIVSINYRLSPRVNSEEELKKLPAFRHPLHLMDVLRALKYLVSQDYNIVLLVGHSVGACFIIQLLNYDRIISQGIKYLNEPFKQEIFGDEEMRHMADSLAHIRLRHVFLLDGIYDVDKLLQEYPEYIPMVRCAFDSQEHRMDATQLSSGQALTPDKLIDDTTTIYIMHSLQDELLSPTQSCLLREYLELKDVTCELVLENWGSHEEVYTRTEVRKFIVSHITSQTL